MAFVTGCLCYCFSMEQHVRGLWYFLGLLQNLSEAFSPYLAFPSANSSNNIPGLTLGSPPKLHPWESVVWFICEVV